MTPSGAPKVGMALVALAVLLGGCGGGNDDAAGTKTLTEPTEGGRIYEPDKPTKQEQREALHQQKENTKVTEAQVDAAMHGAALEPKKKPRFSQENEPGLTVSQQDVYEEAKTVCGLGTPKSIARDFNLRTTDPDVLAERYARGYTAPVKQAAYEGCLDALAGR